MAAVAGGLAREFPETNAGRGVALEPLHDAVIGSELRLTSLLFLGVVGFVLLICCANVANLLLARATVRTRELAIRSALGAERRRVIRQLLTESLLLSIVGGALGLAVGAAILRSRAGADSGGPAARRGHLTFDLRVVAFCAAAALIVGLLFGLAPAWQATAFSPAQAIASESRTATGARRTTPRRCSSSARSRPRSCCSSAPACCCGRCSPSRSVDRGYRAESVLTMIVDPLGRVIRRRRPAPVLRRRRARGRAVPGVQDVAFATTLPLGQSSAGQFFFEVAAPRRWPRAGRRPTTRSSATAYFRDARPADRRRPGFDDPDTARRVPVCIVNEAFVRKHLPGRSPIGQRVALRESAVRRVPRVVREIVGVARQVKAAPTRPADLMQLYVPLAQDPIDDIFMLVRPESGRAEALAPAVRAAIGRIDKEQLVSVREVRTLEDVAQEATARHRFRAVLVMTFAGLALLLAMVGLFGILAYSVQQRMRDFGVRRALGATTGDVLRLVVRSAAGVIAGRGHRIGAAIALGRLLADDAVRGPADRPGDVRARHARPGGHGRARQPARRGARLEWIRYGRYGRIKDFRSSDRWRRPARPAGGLVRA